MIIQALLAFFGLTSLWMYSGNNLLARKWAPVVGICGQPFWLVFAWQSEGWGMGLISAAYTLVYARGIWIQFGSGKG